jgi:hypothetical protein
MRVGTVIQPLAFVPHQRAGLACPQLPGDLLRVERRNRAILPSVDLWLRYAGSSAHGFAAFENTTYTKEFAMTAALDPGRPFTGSERELLENTLDLNRRELVRVVEHLSESQSREKRVPSLTTPVSLIKHCAAAERIWFQRTLAGTSVEDCDGHAVGGDGSYHVPEDETLAKVITEYGAACRRSTEIAARFHLDDVVEHHVVGTVSLRFIYLGMIAEVARHAGHADILTE